MRRVVPVLILFVALAAAQLSAQSMMATTPYNKEVTVGIMRENLKQMRAIGGLIESGDYFAAAEAFMVFAKGSHTLMSMAPPKGAEAEWARVHGTLVKAALRGIGACAAEDKTAATAALNEIRALNQQGHSTFR